ncbi:hypothetical protein I6A81_28765 [Frankia sp. CN7]|nr:hypothetical protein [Frankia nepalensis]
MTAQPAAAGTPVPVTISFTKLIQIGQGIDDIPLIDGPIGDFYARVSINGGPWQDTYANRFDFGFSVGTGTVAGPGGTYKLTPPKSWTITQTVDSALGSVPVAIEIWDDDDIIDDQQADVSPTESSTLALTVNLADGKWSGDVAWPGCAEGSGGRAVRLCFAASTLSASGDADGDALFDSWETYGYHGYDSAGNVYVDLPALGANPLRKDVFVEVDCLVAASHSHCPDQSALTDVVRAFAAAPVSNPGDGTTGIQLHLDTGPLYGPGSVQINGSGGVRGSIGNLGGGGSQIPEAGNEIIDWDGTNGWPGTDFHQLKGANFSYSQREDIFRYAIFGHQTNSRAQANDCTSGWAEDIKGNDFMVTLGGGRNLDSDSAPEIPCWTPTASNGIDDDGDGRTDEDPWNDVDEPDDNDCAGDTDGDGDPCDRGDLGVDEDSGFSVGNAAEQAGTFMHELGHTLGLKHGGGDDVNRKPNYPSVMNYAFQRCLVFRSGPLATVQLPGGCDYSRIVVNLDENSLDECAGLGPALDLTKNWDQSVDASMMETLQGATCPPPNNTNLSLDINNDDDGDGTDDNKITPLNGFEDWNNLFFDFQGLPNLADAGPIHPVQYEADPAVIEAAERQMSGFTVAAAPTTLDLTALSASSFSLSGVNGWLNARVTHTRQLAPGRYTVHTPGSAAVPFTVNSIGRVDFDPQISYLSGRGTTTLAVQGLPVTVDATSLTAQAFSIAPATGWLNSRTSQVVRLLPGRYSFTVAGSTPVPFTVGADGRVDFDPQIGYASGRGTTTLAVQGLPVTVDATSLTAQAFSIAPATGWLNSRTSQVVRLLPGRYSFTVAGSTPVPFTVGADGRVDFDPQIGYASGRGTTTLAVQGLPVTIDATALTCQAFALSPTTGWIPAHPAAGQPRLLPGSFTFVSCPAGRTFPLVLTPAGTFDYNPGLTGVSGRGTSTLVVG